MTTKPQRTTARKKSTTTGVAAKKPTAARVRKAAKNKVDYYPNRMTFWVSAAAGSIIVLIAVIIAYNK